MRTRTGVAVGVRVGVGCGRGASVGGTAVGAAVGDEGSFDFGSTGSVGLGGDVGAGPSDAGGDAAIRDAS